MTSKCTWGLALLLVISMTFPAVDATCLCMGATESRYTACNPGAGDCFCEGGESACGLGLVDLSSLLVSATQVLATSAFQYRKQYIATRRLGDPPFNYRMYTTRDFGQFVKQKALDKAQTEGAEMIVEAAYNSGRATMQANNAVDQAIRDEGADTDPVRALEIACDAADTVRVSGCTAADWKCCQRFSTATTNPVINSCNRNGVCTESEFDRCGSSGCVCVPSRSGGWNDVCGANHCALNDKCSNGVVDNCNSGECQCVDAFTYRCPGANTVPKVILILSALVAVVFALL